MIGLIDVDSKIPNLALMKISTYYKSLGEEVECERLQEFYEDRIEIDGTGWDSKKTLDYDIEICKPDYDLYSVDDIASRMKGIGTKEHKLKKAAEIVNAGRGFTSRGCIRKCPFCFVPKKEGEFRQETPISDIINSRSNVIILNDNNLTADPNCIEKLHEIRDRKLIVDINQGCDVRLMNDDIAKAMSEVKHLRSLLYASRI